MDWEEIIIVAAQKNNMDPKVMKILVQRYYDTAAKKIGNPTYKGIILGNIISILFSKKKLSSRKRALLARVEKVPSINNLVKLSETLLLLEMVEKNKSLKQLTSYNSKLWQEVRKSWMTSIQKTKTFSRSQNLKMIYFLIAKELSSTTPTKLVQLLLLQKKKTED